MFAFAPIVIMALKARIALEHHCDQRPYYLFGRTECEMPARDQLTENGGDLHRRSFVILLLQDLEVPRVNATALLEQIANRRGAFVIDAAFTLFLHTQVDTRLL